MTAPEPSRPTPNRTAVAGVSRRFGVAHMMVGVTLFALLFSSLEVFGVRDLDSPWIVYASCALFCAAIPLGQVLLYQGREPRRASCLVGARLLPVMALDGVIPGGVLPHCHAFVSFLSPTGGLPFAGAKMEPDGW